jgi:hypothetical protein
MDEVEIHAQWNHVKQQKLLLSDENKTCIPFVLWDDQISLAGLFRFVLHIFLNVWHSIFWLFSSSII